MLVELSIDELRTLRHALIFSCNDTMKYEELLKKLDEWAEGNDSTGTADADGNEECNQMRQVLW